MSRKRRPRIGLMGAAKGRPRSLHLAVVTGALLLPASSESQQAESALRDSLGIFFERLGEFGVSGAALVAQGDQILVESGFGSAHDAAGVPLRAETPMAIASMSKPITASAILRLQDLGKLSVSDTLGRFFTGLNPGMAGTSLRALLTHTAGLPYLGPWSLIGHASRDAVFAEALALEVDPAKVGGHHYSNPGYTILAAVIENASGKDYEELLREQVFGPAGMSRSGFLQERDRWDRDAQVHSYSGSDEGSLAEFPPLDRAVGAGSIVSTVGDLYRWVRALESGAFLSDSSRAMVLEPHAQVSEQHAFGFGWNIVTTVRGTRLAFHGGDLGGYNGEIRRYIDEGLVVIFLSNRRIDGVGSKTAVMNPLALRIKGEPHPAPPPAEPLSTEDGSQLVGQYRMADQGGTFVVASVPTGWVLGGYGRAAVAALAPIPPQLAPAASDVETRATAVLDGLIRRDWTSLRDHLSPSLPFDAVRSSLQQQLAIVETQVGAPQSAEIVGTTVRSPGSGSTVFRVTYESGERVGQIDWMGGKIGSFVLDQPVPLAIRLAGEGEGRGRLVAYHPFTGTTVRLLTGTDASGTRWLKLDTPGGLVEAQRAATP